jgi:hypothetical protein
VQNRQLPPVAKIGDIYTLPLAAWLSGQPHKRYPTSGFAQAETLSFLAGDSSEKSKFFHVISQRDPRYAAEEENIITSQPEGDPYTTLTTELVRRLSPLR